MIVVSSCVGVCVEGPLHFFWDDRRKVTVFIPFRKNCLLVHGLDPVHGLGHGHCHGPVLGVVVWVDLGWRFEWTCGAPRDDPPLHTL